MAEYMTVPARNLVPLGEADPVNAAPLSDAALLLLVRPLVVDLLDASGLDPEAARTLLPPVS